MVVELGDGTYDVFEDTQDAVVAKVTLPEGVQAYFDADDVVVVVVVAVIVVVVRGSTRDVALTSFISSCLFSYF